jgi:hypothetical protein
MSCSIARRALSATDPLGGEAVGAAAEAVGTGPTSAGADAALDEHAAATSTLATATVAPAHVR